MRNKKFNRALYDTYDTIAKTAAIDFYHIRGYSIRENEDKYGPDLILETDNGIVAYVECEVKQIWQGRDFPFNEINIPQRKQKFFNMDYPVLIFMCNATYRRALIVPSYIVKECPLIEVSNKYMKSDEYFYKVPIKMVKIVDI